MLARDETFIHRDNCHGGLDKPVDKEHIEDGTGRVEHEKATNAV